MPTIGFTPRSAGGIIVSDMDPNNGLMYKKWSEYGDCNWAYHPIKEENGEQEFRKIPEPEENKEEKKKGATVGDKVHKTNDDNRQSGMAEVTIDNERTIDEDKDNVVNFYFTPSAEGGLGTNVQRGQIPVLIFYA